MSVANLCALCQRADLIALREYATANILDGIPQVDVNVLSSQVRRPDAQVRVIVRVLAHRGEPLYIGCVVLLEIWTCFRCCLALERM
jgi:hypothetical protein